MDNISINKKYTIKDKRSLKRKLDVKQKKVFILEDNNQRINQFKIKLQGHDLHITNDVEEAKKILLANDFDYAFLDHDLGGKTYVDNNESNTGYQLAKWMAESEIIPQIIVIHSLNTIGAKNMKAVLSSAMVVPFPTLINGLNNA